MFRRTWTVRLPVLPDDDEGVLVWLLRESAEHTAHSYLLEVVEFDDLGEVPAEDIDPRGVKELGPAYAGCRFRAFRVAAERPADA